MISSMAMRELHFRYAGTAAGLIWSVVNPLVMIAVYWFVFSVGLKVRPMGDMPFILVFMCGYAPWSFFLEAVTGSTNSITGNAHLVKKTVFPTEVLPLVQMGSAIPTHVVMLLALTVMMAINGVPFSFYNLQFIYYFIASMVFTLGLSWLVAAANVIFRDMGQIMGVIINIWFWLTPIVWPEHMIPERYAFLLKANPVYYVVAGYRSSFLTHEFIFNDPAWSFYFWAVAIAMFVFGGVVFKRLKPVFPDVM